MPEKHNVERRERYTKAVEQLGSKEAPVRIGGVYTLVGLVDEWLLDENLDYTEKVREGQVIINNLCAYIRSSFALAFHYDELTQESPTAEGLYKNREQDFYIDKAEFKSEADIRLSIIKEIHDRLQSPKINTPGAWSDFEYDFSGSTFFYPVDLTNSYYKKPVNFSGSTYQGDADFESSTYQSRADFSDSIYRCWADFRSSTYQSQANFSGSTYQDGATFNGSTYTGWANFNCSTYQSWADFSASTYQDGATFMSSTYQSEADFSNSTCQSEVYFSDSTYKGKADFCGSTYQNEVYFSYSTYQSEADFSDSICQGKADFSDSTYRGWADFRNSAYQGRAGFTDSIYQNEVYFSGSTYEDKADFSGSIFCGDVYYGKDRYNSNFSRFTECTPQFYNENSHQNTLFGSPDNDFSVENGRGYPVYRNLDGLPLGCDFLTAEQKEYLADKFQEIDETKNKFLEVKDPKEKAELSENLQALDKNLYEWREEATTVKAEGTTSGEQDN